MTSIKFIPTMGEIAQLSGDTEPDILDTKDSATYMKNLYDSITGFDVNNDKYGSSSMCAGSTISLSPFGKNINDLWKNSGKYGAFMLGNILDYNCHPSTKHGKDKTHNVYDEYRWSWGVISANCDVDNGLIGEGPDVGEGLQWYYTDGSDNVLPKEGQLFSDIIEDVKKLNYTSLAIGGVPISQVYNRIRNLSINSPSTASDTTNNPLEPYGLLGIYTYGDGNNGIYPLSDQTNHPTYWTASNGKTSQSINRLQDTNDGHIAKILLDTSGYTSHSKRIKYWDAKKSNYLFINRNLKSDDPSKKEDPRFGPCAGGFGITTNAKIYENACPLYINNKIVEQSPFKPDPTDPTDNTSYIKPRYICLTQDITQVSSDPDPEKVNTDLANCEGGVIDNALAIQNLANSTQCQYNIIHLKSDTEAEWVNANCRLKDKEAVEIKSDIYTPHQIYDGSIKTKEDLINVKHPRVQYQIIHDFENDPNPGIYSSEWGTLGTKGGVSTSSILDNLIDDGVFDDSPGMNNKKVNQHIKWGRNSTDYYKIIKYTDTQDSKIKTCLQLRTSPSNNSDITSRGSTTISGILCSSMFYGSCEITVKAKFPPITGGIFAIWTFRSDLTAASNQQGQFSIDSKTGTGKGTEDGIDNIIGPSMPCQINVPDPLNNETCPVQQIPENTWSGKSCNSDPNIKYSCDPSNVCKEGGINTKSTGYAPGTIGVIGYSDRVKIDWGDILTKYDENNKFNFSIPVNCYLKPREVKQNDGTTISEAVVYSNGFMQSPYENVIEDTDSPYTYGLPTCLESDKIKNIFNPLYNFAYIDQVQIITPDGTKKKVPNLDLVGNSNRNDEIDIEIPSNSPGCHWSSQYWSTDIKKGYNCTWTLPFKTGTIDKIDDNSSGLNMGMWNRMNNNSYAYTNNQGSGSVPYVNMWADSNCRGVFGENYTSNTKSNTFGGAIVCPIDTSVQDCRISCSLNGGSSTYNDKTSGCNGTDRKNKQYFVNANEYIEIISVLPNCKMSKVAGSIYGEKLNTTYFLDQSDNDCKGKIKINNVKLHYDTLNPVSKSGLTKTNSLDEKWHDYTITWQSGSPPLDENGDPYTPENPGNNNEYWDLDQWRIKPTATFYVDGQFLSKTSAFIPRRYSRINIGFINPTNEFNNNWHGPFPRNVKYAHTYIKKITITPFINENDNINTSKNTEGVDESQMDYWWPPWKDSPTDLRSGSLYSFFKPIGITSMNSSNGNEWYGLQTIKDNYKIGLSLGYGVGDYNTTSPFSDGDDKSNLIGYWGRNEAYKNDDTGGDSLVPVTHEIEWGYPDSIYIGDGSIPTTVDNENCRIVFCEVEQDN